MKWDEMNPVERDRLVSEKVMGWIEEVVSPTGFKRWYEYKDGTRYDVSKRASLFLPSRDLSDAWRVVERFDGYSIEKFISNQSYTVCVFNPSSYYAQAMSVQEAICKAALKAVGVDIE